MVKMLQEVGIVLNERENQKAELAAKLEQHLREHSITSSRFEIGPHIMETLYQERPSILVLDYILGDYTTGLDVLEQFRNLKPFERPSVYFLTDEPNASVATDAMRLGAKHFLQLENPKALPILVKEIETQLCLSDFGLEIQQQRQAISLDNLIAESSSMKALIHELRTYLKKKTNFLSLVGPTSSGKSTLLRAYHNDLFGAYSYLHEIDLKRYTDDVRDLFKEGEHHHADGILISNIEQDDGELLEYLIKSYSTQNKSSQLYFTSTDIKTAKAFESLLDSNTLFVPGLSKERSADIVPLVQKFTREANNLFKAKFSPPGKATIEWISKQTWNKNISQLRACLLDVFAHYQPKSDDFLKNLQERYERSCLLQRQLEKSEEPSEQTLKQMLEIHNYRYRIVAAKYGLTLNELHKKVSTQRS